MSVIRVFLSADSEFVIENLLKPKGNPEISARGKSTLFFAVFGRANRDPLDHSNKFGNQNVRHQKLHNICQTYNFWG